MAAYKKELFNWARSDKLFALVAGEEGQDGVVEASERGRREDPAFGIRARQVDGHARDVRNHFHRSLN